MTTSTDVDSNFSECLDMTVMARFEIQFDKKESKSKDALIMVLVP